ncbi:major facilitator superfamily domain-containing protein [Lactifluus volemus]|nr:major facilitator superfamily domain-containing protein [Lactifluus volemus]
MTTPFHDTFFAHVLRSAFGSRVFPYQDEIVLPTIWQDKLTLQASPRGSIQPKLDDTLKPDAASVLSEAVATANTQVMAYKDPLLISWEGPDDPDNPRNWSGAKKAWVMFQTCLLTFAVTLGPAIYTAGIPYVVSEFRVSTVAATVGLTAFLAGCAFGGATIADLYTPKKRAYGMTLWSVFAGFGPSVGPLLGSFAAHVKGWRWTIWEIMWLSGATLILDLHFQHSLPPRWPTPQATGNSSIKSSSEIAAAAMSPRDRVLNVLTNSRLSFLGISIGSFIVMPPFFAYLYYVQEPKYNDKGELKPEERMPVAIFGAILLPISLFWFGWTAHVHWIMPIIGAGLFSIATLLLLYSVLTYLADAYPKYAASVLAGNGFIRSIFGAVFPLFAGAMYSNLDVGWASTLLALLACLFVPIPILLYKYGERIRRASKRARHDYE